MALTWANWAHVVWSARGQWLPGDVRGFRDHGHRIHSSGDYRILPPAEEHRGLRQYARAHSAAAVFIPKAVQGQICAALSAKWDEMGIAVRIIATDSVHVHALIRAGAGDAKPLVARAKQRSSHQVRDVMPGSVWGQGCHVVRIRDELHWRAVVDYIANHASAGATVWEPDAIRAARARRLT